jgi:diazepam-binding inhibitor (GABA receptor modulating acyl-CoA-binding protein)
MTRTTRTMTWRRSGLNWPPATPLPTGRQTGKKRWPALGTIRAMTDLTPLFEQALADSKTLPERPDNATLLQIYALYKQGSTGDATGDRPGFTDFVARAKFDAWAALAGTPQPDAMQRYIDLIESLK